MLRVNHYIGGIFLVSGTAIGAGMLALPVTTGIMGLVPSLVLFAICWLAMLISAFFFLDVNLSVKGEPNLISMAHRTLGTWGKALSWVVYLLLLYSLIAAFIAGSGPIFIAAIHSITGWTAPDAIGLFLLPLLFGGLIYFRLEGVDLVNRLLMIGLFVAYIMLIGAGPAHIEPKLLKHIDWKPFIIGFPLTITSFGYHIIIPTLSTYVNHDRKKLKRIILIGSVLPLIFYIVWQALVIGVVPATGPDSLATALEKGQAATMPLVKHIQSPWLSKAIQFFSFFAIATSFLGVSISLSDFLRDGLKIRKGKRGKLYAMLLTFIPPLIFVLTYQRGFIVALEYAGAFVAILLLFLPAIMAWQLKAPKFYKTQKAKIVIIAIICFATGVVIIDILHQMGWFHSLIKPYVSA